RVLDQLVAQDRPNRGRAGRAGERIAAEGRAVVARLEHGDPILGHAGPDRHAAAEPLGQREDVRLDAVVLVAHELAGPPDPGLNLVEDQQGAALVTEPARLPDE